jgi:hypothetical protein
MTPANGRATAASGVSKAGITKACNRSGAALGRQARGIADDPGLEFSPARGHHAQVQAVAVGVLVRVGGLVPVGGSHAHVKPSFRTVFRIGKGLSQRIR